MNLQRIPLESICIFKISTMYKFWTNIPAQPSIYPAFKVVFLYFNKKMPNVANWEASFRKYPSKKNPMAEREPGSPPLPHGEPPGISKSLGFLWRFFPPWVKWWQLKDFLFSPQSLGEMIQFDEHIFWTGLKPPEIEVVPLPKFFPGLPLKSERKPIGKDRLNQPQTTIFQVGELLNLQGYRTSTWFL